MSETHIDYQALLHKALRGTLREILKVVEDKGLRGGHHYYITFKTAAEGVEIPDHLKQRYPEEMTIVLQHRFWDLHVADDHFAVKLSFNQKPERLRIPFDAIASLVDPSVRFALQFESDTTDKPGEEKMFEKPEAQPRGQDTAPEAEPSKKRKAGNVVALDAFRKN